MTTGKYGDLDWLKRNGQGSWPVAYRAVRISTLAGLLKGSHTGDYRKSIYCAQDITYAKLYCRSSYTLSGQEFYFVLKCRVNPNFRTLTKGMWAISDSAWIRYYKICIYQQNVVTGH